jgi:hypothetical protein
MSFCCYHETMDKPKRSGSSAALAVGLGIARVASFFGGLIVLAFGVFSIGLGQCHDRGGFCAGVYNSEYYVFGAVAFLFGGLLIGFFFTSNVRKLGFTALGFFALALLWAILSEAQG